MSKFCNLNDTEYGGCQTDFSQQDIRFAGQSARRKPRRDDLGGGGGQGAGDGAGAKEEEGRTTIEAEGLSNGIRMTVRPR